MTLHNKCTTYIKLSNILNFLSYCQYICVQGADQVTAICRTDGDIATPNTICQELSLNYKPLSEAQKLRKVIVELIETERAYVKDLNCLTERYLEPLKEESFLTSDKIEQLFGNIQEIVIFQRQFLKSLEEAMQLEEEFFTTEDPKSYRVRSLFVFVCSTVFVMCHFSMNCVDVNSVLRRQYK